MIGNAAYVADGDSGLAVIDVSNPAKPTLIGSVETPGNAQSVTVVENTAYVANGERGLAVIDVSTPVNPTVIGFIDTRSYAFGVTVIGAMAYVSDGDAGLTVAPILKEVKLPTVVDSSTISLSLPPPTIHGNYTLRVFNNAGDYAELPGAVNFSTLDLATLDPNALFLQTIDGKEPAPSLTEGQSLDLQLLYKAPSGTPFNLSNLPNFPVEWFSSNPAIFKVSPLGHLTAQAPGSAVITAQTTAGKQSVTITVEGAPTPANSGNLIIVAGRKYKDETLAGYFNSMANAVYQTFQARGFGHDDIQYFNSYSAQFLAEEPATNIVDRLVGLTEKNLASEITTAITTWAASQKNSGPLYLYLIDHGASGQAAITVTPSSILVAAQIDAALTTFEAATARPVIVVVEACYSGAWITTLQADNRVVITNTNATPAWLLTNATNSFTGYLMDELSKGLSLQAAFAAATQSTQLTFSSQQPQNWGTIPSALWVSPLVGDYASANGNFFTDYAGKADGVTVQSGAALTLSATVTVLAAEGVKVKAQIIPQPPLTKPDTMLTPTYSALIVPLTWQGSSGDTAIFSAWATISLPPGPCQVSYILTNAQGEEFVSDQVTMIVNGEVGVTTTTTTSTTTTTEAPTTTTPTTPGQSLISLSVSNGWSLLSSTISFEVATVFGESSKFTSIWKWTSGSQGPKTWAVYLPGEPLMSGAYAASKGFVVLSKLEAGEGFWVNKP